MMKYGTVFADLRIVVSSFSSKEADMSAIRFGGKMLGVLALAGVIGAGALLVGCGRSETPAQSVASERASATAPAATSPGDKAPADHAQTTCPVMGGKINKAIFADYQGKRVYFCCGACPAEFKKDPAKYVKILEDQGVVLDKTPQ
jgi:YHS domain-containing protein